MTTCNTDIHDRIERRLGERLPDVELLAVQRTAAERLRLTIDRSGGVDLALCERVTGALRDLLVDYSLEVSSPGPQRPLTRPDHFRRFLGRRARVRTRVHRDGHRSFTGELVGATDAEVTVAAEGGVVSIPYGEIRASHLCTRGDDGPAGAGERGQR